MTKRAILIAICENPGWQPTQPIASHVETGLSELRDEGWIVPRLDGWEATGAALHAYPQFSTQLDIADPEATMRIAPSDAPTVAGPGHDVVAIVKLEGKGYEVEQDKTGRYHTRIVEPGSVRDGFGHYQSIRLLAELSRLLAEIVK